MTAPAKSRCAAARRRWTRIAFGGEPLAHYTLATARVTSQGRRARTASGDGIERLALRRAGDKGEATLTVVEDFAPCARRSPNVAWPDAPFSRARMRAALGLDARAACCEDAAGPGARRRKTSSRRCRYPPQAAEFQSHCAACHRTPERFPPNFLAGDAQRVTRKPGAVRAAHLRAPGDVADTAGGARQGAHAAATRIARREPVDSDGSPIRRSLRCRARSPVGCARRRAARPMPRRCSRAATRICGLACRT